MRIIRISTLEYPELEPYRTLRGRTHHWKDGFFVAEGEKAIRALLASNLRVKSLLMNEDWLDVLEVALRRGNTENSDVYVADETLMEGIVGFPLHQKLLAIGEVPDNPPLEALNPPLEALNEVARPQAVHVALEGIADAENMGMILRNCAAFGAASLLVGSDSSNPWLRRSVRVSLGNIFALRIHRADNILDVMRRCRDEFGWRIVGTTPRGGASAIEASAADPRPLCLFFGSEATGLTDAALALCDERFTIHMRNDVDSINVANAVAVTLFEAMR
jgi:tRNA G18 (ribose-2'-O)-methylase SpoU